MVRSWDIILPKPKKLTEANKVNYPKYYKFHRLLGHTLQECFVFKDKFQELLDKKIVEIDTNMRLAVTNVVFINEDNEAQNTMLPQVNLDDEGDDWAIF